MKTYSVLTRRLTALITLICLFSVFGNAAETAQQVLSRASTAFRNAKALTASFTMAGAMGSTSGTFYYSAGKFAVITGAASTWYNGRNMWSYNPRTAETTVMKPSAEEASENNPFAIVGAMSDSFIPAFAKSQPAGTVVLVLLPKNSRNSIKKCILTLDKTRLTPVKVQITDASGTTLVNVSKFVSGKSLAASLFEYPKSKYPKAKIVDLR